MGGVDQHRGAGLETGGNVGSDGLDLAGAVRSEDVWELVLDPQGPFQGPEIEVIEGRGFDADQHLARARLGVGDVAQSDMIEPVIVDRNGLHLCSSSR